MWQQTDGDSSNIQLSRLGKQKRNENGHRPQQLQKMKLEKEKL